MKPRQISCEHLALRNKAGRRMSPTWSDASPDKRENVSCQFRILLVMFDLPFTVFKK